MADLLRAARRLPAFAASLDIHLVEASPVLRAAQRATLRGGGPPVAWAEGLDAVPRGPMILIANEFFDALPVRHYVRTPEGWRERLVGLDGGDLRFGLSPLPEPTIRVAAPEGAILEVGIAAQMLGRTLAERLARDGGAALVIDYGYVTPAFAETLQAVRRHGFADPLADAGEADLSAHVDFGGLSRAARAGGAAVHGPVPQGVFLRRLGITARAEVLRRRATPAQAADLDAALNRLITPGTAERPGMGDLFKALCLTAPDLAAPPGFVAETDA